MTRLPVDIGGVASIDGPFGLFAFEGQGRTIRIDAPGLRALRRLRRDPAARGALCMLHTLDLALEIRVRGHVVASVPPGSTAHSLRPLGLTRALLRI